MSDISSSETITVIEKGKNYGEFDVVAMNDNLMEKINLTLEDGRWLFVFFPYQEEKDKYMINDIFGRIVRSGGNLEDTTFKISYTWRNCQYVSKIATLRMNEKIAVKFVKYDNY